MIQSPLIITSLLVLASVAPAAETTALSPLPLPTAAELAAHPNQPIPATETHPEEWANPGSLGPTGLIAQRCMTRLEYRILVVELTTASSCPAPPRRRSKAR